MRPFRADDERSRIDDGDVPRVGWVERRPCPIAPCGSNPHTQSDKYKGGQEQRDPKRAAAEAWAQYSVSRVLRVVVHDDGRTDWINGDVPGDFLIALDRHRVVGVCGAGILPTGNGVFVSEVPGGTRFPPTRVFADGDCPIGRWPASGHHLARRTGDQNDAHEAEDQPPEESENNGGSRPLPPSLPRKVVGDPPEHATP